MRLARRPKTLDTPTAAGRALTFICCDLPTTSGREARHQFDGWVLSPAGDRVSAVNSGDSGHGQEIEASRTASWSPISTEAGRNSGPSRRCAIGAGAIWSPDQSALVVAACLPCNDALEMASRPRPKTTTISSSSRWTVPRSVSCSTTPVDGSRLPSWSPDRSTFATVKRECASKSRPRIAPQPRVSRRP